MKYPSSWSSPYHGLAQKYLPKAAGVEPDMVRLSIGLEDLDDLLWDLDQALTASQG